VKTQYSKKKEELDKIDIDQDIEPPRHRLKANKSLSFKHKPFNVIKSLQFSQKFKEDDVFGLQGKDETKPVTKKNTLRKSPSDVGAYFMGKRTAKPLQVRQNAGNSSGMSSNVSDGASPNNVLGNENILTLLRSNSNHIAPMSGFNTTKAVKEGAGFKEAVKNWIDAFPRTILPRKVEEKVEKIEEEEAGNKGNKVEKTETRPEVLAPFDLRESIGMWPVKENKFTFDEKVQENKPCLVKERKKSLRRNSLGLFKALRNEESLSNKDFPSLVGFE